ncbi:MAG: hypothetical protein GY744_00360 [Gammaproteobacteria bacterium]|nr:hypothetical protein [Gammaproteobacteria bacterium]
MARIIARNVDNVNPNLNSVVDAEVNYKRGDIVSVLEDGSDLGTKVTLPRFIVIDVAGVTAGELTDYLNEWKPTLKFTLLNTNAALDGFRVKMVLENGGSQYTVTKAQVENWLTSRGVSIFSDAANEIVFDFVVGEYLQSTGFWGFSPVLSNLGITETAYRQTTGEHDLTIDFSGFTGNKQTAKSKLLELDPESLVVTNSQAVTTVTRNNARDHFYNSLREAFEKSKRRRQYYFSGADCDAATNAGGILTVTKAQVAAHILDKAT